MTFSQQRIGFWFKIHKLPTTVLMKNAWINLQTRLKALLSRDSVRHRNWEQTKAMLCLINSRWRATCQVFEKGHKFSISARTLRMEVWAYANMIFLQVNLLVSHQLYILNLFLFGSSLIHHSQFSSLFNASQMVTKREESSSTSFEIWLARPKTLCSVVILLWKFHSWCGLEKRGLRWAQRKTFLRFCLILSSTVKGSKLLSLSHRRNCCFRSKTRLCVKPNETINDNKLFCESFKLQR